MIGRSSTSVCQIQKKKEGGQGCDRDGRGKKLRQHLISKGILRRKGKSVGLVQEGEKSARRGAGLSRGGGEKKGTKKLYVCHRADRQSRPQSEI